MFALPVYGPGVSRGRMALVHRARIVLCGARSPISQSASGVFTVAAAFGEHAKADVALCVGCLRYPWLIQALRPQYARSRCVTPSARSRLSRLRSRLRRRTLKRLLLQTNVGASEFRETPEGEGRLPTLPPNAADARPFGGPALKQPRRHLCDGVRQLQVASTNAIVRRATAAPSRSWREVLRELLGVPLGGRTGSMLFLFRLQRLAGPSRWHRA